MGLVVICGKPLSGKTSRAKELQEHLEKAQFGKCVLVSDEDKLLDVGPTLIYTSSHEEKELRSSLKSAVQRNLSLPDTTVIIDSANYIKGYRYELYCLSKQFRTTHIVIECEEAPEDVVESQLVIDEDADQNSKRKYTRKIFTELEQRFEKPDANNRWDSPLFCVPYGAEIKLPIEEIKVVLKGAVLKPNQSTQSLPTTTDNYLYELDSQTQEVIKQIQVALQSSQLRGIKVKNSEMHVNLLKKMPIAELNKLRRQFINYTRIQPLTGKDRIASAFVQFINNSVS